jgi:hypothetical protein
VWGRQSGKTTNGTWTMFKKPLIGRQHGVYWHILQTHTAAEVAFNRYVKLFPRAAWPYLWAKKPNESEKTVFLTGFREVHFKSGEKPNNLRVETLDGAIIDECREQDEILWTQVVRPMLGRRKGWAEFYSTPNGFDWFYDLSEAAKKKSDWEVIHAPSTEAWWWDKSEIDSAKDDMALPEFEQEIMAEFRDLTSGKAYHAFGNHNDLRESPWCAGRRWSPYHPIILGADFNLSPMHWNLGQYAGDFYHWFDEIHLTNSHTTEAAFALRDKILAMIAEGFRGEPHLIICGDATGKATQRTSNASDYDILKEVLKDAGIRFEDRTPESNPPIKDRVNAVNAKCRNAHGQVQLFVDFDRCPKLVYDFQRVLWKPGVDIALDPGKKKDLTHATDGVGYAVFTFSPVKGVREIGATRIISRSF